METRSPSIPRDGAARQGGRDGIRRWGAAAVSVLGHGALALAVTLSALVGREPPRIEVEEPIAVELVTDAAIGLRTPRPAADLPVEAAAPAAPPAAAGPADAERTDLAAAAPTTDVPALAPAEASAPVAAMPPALVADSPLAFAELPYAPKGEAAPQAVASTPPPPDALPSMPTPAAVASTAAGTVDATSPAEDAEAVPDVTPPGPTLGLAPSGPLDAGPLPVGPSTPSTTSTAPADVTAPSPVASAPAVPTAAESLLAALPVPSPAPSPATAPAPDGPSGPVALAAVAPPVAIVPADPRQAVDAVLKGLDCARVGASLDPLAGTLVLRGHVPSAETRDRLVAALAAEPGIRRVDAGGLGLMGEPYCRILAFLDRPDFARSSEQRGDLAAIGAANPPGRRRLRGGDALDLHVAAPDFDSYLYVDHFSADGRVTHLLPTSRPDNALRADEEFGLGPDGRGRRAIAMPPYGLDVVTVLAASEPLVPPGRPIQEDAAAYLAALDAAVRRLAAAGRAPRYEYGYYLVATEPPPGESRPVPAPARAIRGRPGG